MRKRKTKTLAVVTTALLCCNLMPVGTVWAGSYEIQPGDTLQTIANSHKITVEELQKANQLQSTMIYAGEVLYIPDGTITYRVTAGDSLYKIAARYQTTVERLKELNQLTSDHVQSGQLLRLPALIRQEGTDSYRSQTRDYTQEEWDMLAQVVYGEARGEMFTGQVAVAAVVLNRMDSMEFPDTMAGVVFQKGAFTCVSDGQYYLRPDSTAYLAAQAALEGEDPTWGCLYYWNPITATSQWIWTRNIETQIGNHVFGN